MAGLQAQIPTNVPQRYSVDVLGGRAPSGAIPRPVGVNPMETTQVYVQNWSRHPILWFIIIALIVGVLLWIFRPVIVLSVNPATGTLQIDWGKLVLWSLGIALVLAFFYWLGRQSNGMRLF